MKSYTQLPIFFNRNLVYRLYKGGALFSTFFDDKKEDSNFPEEWIASTVKALNKESSDPNEGLSLIKDTSITLKELFDKYPKEMLGPTGSFHLLVKLLDSAIRLPLQVHPDSNFSKRHLNSDFGKTEMWIILDTREDASICFGFEHEITKEAFLSAIEQSKEEKDTMAHLLNRIPVKAGDIFLIPSKSVHAIGAGCLILEIQEPTDFTIQPEYWCGDYLLNEEEMYLGLSRDDALDCFDYSVFGSDCIHISRKIPRIVFSEQHITKEALMTYDDTPCFAVNRYTVNEGLLILGTAPAIYIVTDGNGKITGLDYNKNIRKGDYFFLPYDAKDMFTISSDSVLKVVECLPAKHKE